MIVQTETIDVNALSASAIDVTPERVDGWSETYGETWGYIEAPCCNGCGSYARWDDDAYAWRCDGSADCGYHGAELDPFEHGAEGPMMNYYYPLPSLGDADDEYDAAERIRDLPLCVIRWEDGRDDTYALALTGGGMDFSWQICEAFVRLGFLPPEHFSDLPGMAGVGVREDERVVVRACVRTFERAAEMREMQAENARDYADRLRKRYGVLPEGVQS